MTFNNIMKSLKEMFFNIYYKICPKCDKKLKFPIKAIYFYQDGCSHCEKFSPKFDEYVKSVDKDIIQFEKNNIGENQEKKNSQVSKIPQGFEVEGTPTVIFINKDDEILKDMTFEGDNFEDFKKSCKKIKQEYTNNK